MLHLCSKSLEFSDNNIQNPIFIKSKLYASVIGSSRSATPVYTKSFVVSVSVIDNWNHWLTVLSSTTLAIGRVMDHWFLALEGLGEPVFLHAEVLLSFSSLACTSKGSIYFAPLLPLLLCLGDGGSEGRGN